MKTYTKTIDTETIKRNTNLIDLASRYTELRGIGGKEASGACPKCGGTDRFHVTADMFFCRQCYNLGNGKPHDAIAFVQWVDGCDFVTACNILGGTVSAPQRAMVQPVRKVEADKPWNEEKERNRAEDMHSALMRGKSSHAIAALEYLFGRGINQETIEAYRIGLRLVTLPGAWDSAKNELSYPRQLAISLPWFNYDGALMAVKYRFVESHTYSDLDGKERTENKTSRGNMAGQLFGWQALKGSRTCHTLIVCEGEMNALSLSLAGGGAIDVLSAGNESQLSHIPQLAVEKAKEYKRVIVWADRKEIADSASLCIPSSKRFHSPGGMDANDILKAGKLSDLLAAMIERYEPIKQDHELDVLAQVEKLLTSSDWKRSQAATWVYRWLNGYTEDTPHTRRNVETAAAMLGVQL